MEQIRRLYFRSSSGKQACYRRLSQLIEADYLDATPIPSLSGLGSRYFLTAGKAGRRLVADRWEVTRAQLQRATPVPSISQQPHHLAIGDFRVSLQLAAEAAGVSVEWTSERLLKRTPIKVGVPTAGGKAETMTINPDGLFSLDGEHTFYFEQDMGTHHQSSTRAKLRAYLLLSQKLEPPLPVLWVCPSQKRLQELAAWAQLEGQTLGADSTIFWLTTQDQIDQSQLLMPIWQVVGWAGKCSLTGASQTTEARQPVERFEVAQLYAQSVPTGGGEG